MTPANKTVNKYECKVFGKYLRVRLAMRKFKKRLEKDKKDKKDKQVKKDEDEDPDGKISPWYCAVCKKVMYYLEPSPPDRPFASHRCPLCDFTLWHDV